MWTLINVGLIAAVVACSTAVAAELSGQIATEPANGDPAVRYAQAAREQRSSNAPQISYNIVTDGGAA